MTNGNSLRSSINVLLVVVFANFTVSLPQQVGSVLPLIIDEFQIPYAQAGLLITMASIPGLLSIFVGVLADRFGAKLLGILGIMLLAVGYSIFAASPFFTILLFGQLIAGIAALAWRIAMPMTISQHFTSRRVGIPMGVITSALTTAYVVNYVAFSTLGTAYGWRTPFYITNVLLLVAAISFFLIVKNGSLAQESVQKTEEQSIAKRALSNPEIWKIALVMFFISSSMRIFVTWFPTFLVETKGLGLFEASLITSLSLFICLPLSPFWGWFSDRVGKRKIVLAVACISWVIVLPLMTQASINEVILLVFAHGFLSCSMPVLSRVLVIEVTTSEQRGIGFGVYNFFITLGGIIGPPLAGYGRDITGSMHIVPIIAGAVVAGGAIAAFLLKTR